MYLPATEEGLDMGNFQMSQQHYFEIVDQEFVNFDCSALLILFVKTENVLLPIPFSQPF